MWREREIKMELITIIEQNATKAINILSIDSISLYFRPLPACPFLYLFNFSFRYMYDSMQLAKHLSKYVPVELLKSIVTYRVHVLPRISLYVTRGFYRYR